MRIRQRLLPAICMLLLLPSLSSVAQIRGERSEIMVAPALVTLSRAAKLPARGIESEEEEEEGERDADMFLTDDTPPAELERLRRRVLNPGEGGGTPIVDQTDRVLKNKSRKLLSAPTLGRNFTGITSTGWYPPDPAIAASDDHIVEVANSTIRVMNKSGALLNSVTFLNFFAGVTPPNFIFDPKVVYDPDGDRFIVLVLALDNATQIGYYLVAASRTSDPTAQWWSYKLNARLDGNTNSTNWADYPGLGFDDQAVYLTSNQFTLANNNFSYAKIRILDKSVLYAGGNLNWFDFTNMRNDDNSLVFTIKPAVTYGQAGGEYLVNTKPNGGTFVSLWKITNPLAPNPTLARQNNRTNVGAYALPPNGSQQGGCPNLEVGDCRTQDAVWRDGTLYTGFCEGHNWGGGAVASLRLLKINTATAAAAQDYTFGQNGVHYFYPNVTADACGRMYIVCHKSSTALFTQVHTIIDPWVDPTTTLLKGGTVCYNVTNQREPRNRWGDYSGIAVDPANGVWAVGEYATAATQWGTWVGEITSGGSSLAAAPGRDTAVCRGGSAPITVTATGGTGPYAYLWSPAAGLSSASEQSPTATPTATTSYHVDVTDACGAVTSATVTVTVNPLPTPAIAGPQSVCVGAMIPYSTPYAPGRSFSWTVSGGAIIGRPDSSTIVVQWGAAGGGSLQLTETAVVTGCRQTAAPYAVTINPLPVPSITGSGSVCAGATAAYAAPFIPGHRYQWTVSGGAITGRADSNVVAVIWGNGAAGTVRLTETIAATGCAQTSPPYAIVINAPPTADAGPVVEICEGAGTAIGGALPAQHGVPPYSYAWSPAAGLSAADAPRPVASPTATTIYYLKVTDARGCVATDSTLVSVSALPKPQVLSSRLPALCDGESLTLTAEPGFSSYLWSTGETTPAITVAAPGSYAVTVGGKGCFQTSDSIVVALNPKPQPAIQGPTSVCPRSTAPYATPGNQPETYLWSVTGGTIVAGQGTPSIDVRWGEEGAGTVSLIATSAAGCTASASADVSVASQIARPGLAPAGTVHICAGSSVTIEAPAGYADYLWTNGATTRAITVAEAGSYGVRVSDGAGCSNSSEPVSVVVDPLPPVPTLARDPEYGVLYVAGGGGFSYRWYRNDTLIAGAVRDTLLPQGDGRYTVMRVDAAGCFTVSDPYAVDWVASSVAAETGGEGVSIRPNPTRGVFTLEIDPGRVSSLRIVLSGIDGKEMRLFEPGRVSGIYRREIDIRDLPAGVYILELQAGERKWTRKIVKE